MFGRDNTVTKKESLDVLDVMLKALAEIDGSTKVVEEMLLKSCEAYKRAADDYYGGIAWRRLWSSASARVPHT